MKPPSPRREHLHRRIARRYRRLLRFLDRVVAAPDTLATMSAEGARLTAVERWLAAGLHGMIERLQAGQRRLQASEDRFELAVRGANDGIWDWNLETDEVYYSPRWKEMLGYEEHEIAGRFDEWSSRIHPDDRDHALATIRAYVRGETPHYELEHRLRHKNGSYRWIYARGACLRDAAGRAERMTGSLSDVTERRQAEEALRGREAQYRGIFESTADGLVVTDAMSPSRSPAGRRPQRWRCGTTASASTPPVPSPATSASAPCASAPPASAAPSRSTVPPATAPACAYGYRWGRILRNTYHVTRNAYEFNCWPSGNTQYAVRST